MSISQCEVVAQVNSSRKSVCIYNELFSTKFNKSRRTNSEHIRAKGKRNDHILVSHFVTPYTSQLWGMYLSGWIVFIFDFIFFFSYDKSGTVSCRHWARVHKCAATTFIQVSYVNGNHKYPSDCYIIGQTISNGHSRSNRWYRLNLPTGRHRHGYVNGLVCMGNVTRC